MSTQEDVIYAYMAGIVDGEGSIIISKQKRKENRSGCRFYPLLIITNTNKEVLDFFVEKTGYGRVFERPEQQKPYFNSVKNCWRWAVKHTQVGEILKKLLPYLIIKKKQAENVLEFLQMFEGASNYSNLNIEKQFEHYLINRRLNGTELTDEQIEALRPIVREPTQIKKKCIIEDCNKDHYGKGLCRTHWKREYYRTKLAV